MLAWQVHELGEPSVVLRLDEVDDLAPADHEVVVAVEACALNFADTLLCQGRYQESPPLPFTPGLELAGTVVAAGSAAIRELAGICRDLAVAEVVVGLPLRMDGTRGPAAEKAEAFAARLREAVSVPVTSFDERLTTYTAEQALIESGMRREKRRQVIDKLAAQIMLQYYLDARNPERPA